MIDENNKLLNKFEFYQLISQNKKKISDIQSYNLKLFSETNVFESIEKAKDFVGESIPIVNKQNKICGVISEGDLFQIFLKVTKEEKEHENQD